jgi:serine/threonine protein kinase/thioredoxin-like negative regulator of GroEL
MNPIPGSILGLYRLVEPIGEGGMGVVWRARDTALDRDVAIKFLPPAYARDPERLLRFEREAKAAAALSHPNILAIYGFGTHDGSAYAVTELLEGETLRHALGRGPLAVARAVAVAKELARGLAAAHDRGIVHRDLKPENVFLTRDGHTKILDFGLAAQVGPPIATAAADSNFTPTRTSLTTPGTVLGTIGYLSPEQVRGEAADKRSDVFSIGTLVHEMLGGRRPFERATPPETMTAILREEAPPLAGVPPDLERVVRRCLAKSPEERFASARELASELEAILVTESRVRRPWIATVGISAIAVAAIALWRPWGEDPASVPPSRPPASISSLGEPLSPVPEANEYFEKGLLLIRAQLDIPRARAMLERAIALDPGFDSARVVRSLTDLIAIHEGFSNDAGLAYACEREARAVIAKNPDLSSAHGLLGASLLYLSRTEEARREIETALRLDPGSQSGMAWRTLDARHGGRFAEAEAGARAHLDAVPLFWAVRIMLAEILLEQGRTDEARREIEKVFEQDPSNLSAARTMARIQLHGGDTVAARDLLEGISAADHPNFRVRMLWALLLAREGDCTAASASLDPETLKYAGIALFAPAQLAEIHSLCGRNAEALDWLDRAVRAGDGRSTWFRENPLLEGVREEPRFRWIVEAVERE